MTTPRASTSDDHAAKAPATLLALGTVPRPENATQLDPARYAVRTDGSRTRDEVITMLKETFAPEPVHVEPLSDQEPDGLLLTFPHRVFSADTAAAFSLGYAIAELEGVAAAEPDLPTDFYPEPDESAPRDESTGAIGCTVGPASAPADRRWALRKMRVIEAWAWSLEQGRPSRGEGIVIAQPDTGVVSHRELEPDRRVPSFDVIDGDTDPTDPLDDRGHPGHGTGTGSVALSGEQGEMTGSAPLALHMPIRCVRSVIQLSQVNLTKAIDGAVARGAHVITMSLGGIPSWALSRAVSRAVSNDVIVLAAAGNCVRTVVWPARYDDCIAVAGFNAADLPWKGTCRGSAVDFSAPAENVYRAHPDAAWPVGANTEVRPGEGTSFAVALAAGVAACWLAHHGRSNLIREARARGETLQAMFRRLVHATARRTSGWDATQFGAGILDARALLEAPLDLDLGREGTVSLLVDAPHSVRTLIAEHLGAEAVDPALDYERYGPELAYVLLQEAARKPTAQPFDEGVPSAVHNSETLRSAIANPRLREHLESLDGAAAVVR